MLRTILKFNNIKKLVNKRHFCDKKRIVANAQKDDNSSNLNLGDMGSKYQVFRDEDSEVILDVIEEREKYARFLEAEELEIRDPFEGLNLERGKTGVYEIEDLVQALKRENANDIFVAAVPPEYNYVDYICFVTGKSHKHMLAIMQFVRRLFKQKRHTTDIMPKLEGQNSKDWIAIDLGNIALHVFSKEARPLYDLDSLWSLGPEFDIECNKKDRLVEMLEKHTLFLQDLKPADAKV